MKYLSVCSGIEAATQAWHALGWEAVGFSEIEPFPAAVLKHHYPQTTNYGDMTQYEKWNIPIGTIDLLVGGTPCQSFSVAGLRKGLKDPRGGLMLTFLEIAQRNRPRWIVWENVPGVLSSNGGRDFGSFLGALGELGYGWAYRVLDAQWFGVAQRRRRVFVVGCLGDGEAAAKVLFECESVRRDSPPSREKGKGVADDAQKCFAGNRESGLAAALETTCHDYSRADGFNTVIGALCARDFKGVGSQYVDEGKCVPIALAENTIGRQHDVAPSCVSRFGTGGGNVPLVQDISPTLTSKMQGSSGWAPYNETAHLVPLVQEAVIAPTVTQCKGSRGGSSMEAVDEIIAVHKAIAFEPGIATSEGNESRFVEDMSPTLRKDMGDNQVAVAVDTYNHCLQEKAVPIRSTASDICHTGGVINPADRMAVRRLTPRECERLQGFPDDYTMIPWRNKPAEQCPDGPRYKALGNSMAVPCMAWIGKRIDSVERENRKAGQ